ncbi:MAG: hypothetical protein ACLFT2_03220 [Candidatus Brocadiia bacterium]
MRERKEDWRDLLMSHSLAVDTKKLWLGLVATLASVAAITILSAVYTALMGTSVVGAFNLTGDSFLVRLMLGECKEAFAQIAPLLNPFAANVAHFAFSILFYIFILTIWSYCGGAITRLTALQYARDDIPTLSDGLEMVRDKRNAYLFAPLTPLFGLVAFAVCNMLIGVIGSIPYVGPWLMLISLPFVALPAALVATFIIVLGVATFGLMFPAVSIGGKDAFEGWSSAYSYLLWGFNRFVGYTVIAAVLGLLTTLLGGVLAELFNSVLIRTLSIGYLGGSVLEATSGWFAPLLPLPEGAVGLRLASWVVAIVGLLARALVVGYAFSFFFTSNTIICFLLRKHVDRIDIDEIYEETSEDTFEGEFDEVGEVMTEDSAEETTETAGDPATAVETEAATEEEEQKEEEPVESAESDTEKEEEEGSDTAAAPGDEEPEDQSEEEEEEEKEEEEEEE